MQSDSIYQVFLGSLLLLSKSKTALLFFICWATFKNIYTYWFNVVHLDVLFCFSIYFSLCFRGVISPCGTRSSKGGVLTHAFTAAGHSKAVLDIFASDNLLFSASKGIQGIKGVGYRYRKARSPGFHSAWFWMKILFVHFLNVFFVDKTAKIWDLTSGEEVRSLGGHPNNVTRVRFCPSTNLVFTSCAYFMKIWDMRAAPTCIKTIT